MTATALAHEELAAPSLVTLSKIAEACEAGEGAAALQVTAALLASDEARVFVRKAIVPALRRGEAGAALIHVLACYVEAAPAAASERLLLASRLVRAGQGAAARGHLEVLAAQRPHDPDVAVARLQLELREGRSEAAAAIAEGFAGWDRISPRAAHLGMLAFVRAGRPQRALDVFDTCPDEATGDLVGLAVEAHFALGDHAAARRMAQRAIAQGIDNAALRFRLGAIAQAAFDHDRAIVHFTEALKSDPDDLRTLTALGELMLFKSRPRSALAHLDKALKKAPNLDHARALKARALKEVRDFDGAAREWQEIVARQPKNPQWKRQAASALNLAGRRTEAGRLFSELVEQRAAQLPYGFEDGLNGLWSQLDGFSLPSVRFEWAWRLRAPTCDIPREEWERRARWGYLADRLIFDWLECRPDRAEEAMHRLADLERPAQAMEDAFKRSEALVIVTAHIGPMFAAPLAAELIDIETVWLASSPSMPGLAYTPSLISTSDQTEAQVVRQALQALESGKAVAVAVDGAMSLAAPRIVFEGQEVTYSSFAARLAHRRRANSVFVAPQWREGRLAFHLAALPSPQAGERIDDFAARWKDAYLAELRQLLAGEPENLRLSGGIWRHIRTPA